MSYRCRVRDVLGIYALKEFFGLLKWMLLRERVGYECRLLLYEKKLLNTGGSNSLLYLNMNIAI